MAELEAGKLPPVPAQDISLSAQLLAVAWLRWRIFINSTFRRRTSGTRQAIGLAFAILVRIIVWPFLALMVIGPIGGSGFFAWVAIAENHPQRLAPLLAAITLLWVFVNVNGQNVAAVTSNFDPSSLTRFPLRFGRYLVLRTLIGVLTPSTIVGCLALLAAAVGIGVAKPALALPALLVLGDLRADEHFPDAHDRRLVGALAHESPLPRDIRRSDGAVGRWISVAEFSAPTVTRARRTNQLGAEYSAAAPESQLHWLAPGFAANAILQAAHPIAALAQIAGLLAYTALFAAVFAIRLHKQFLGEFLSEGASRRANERIHPAKCGAYATDLLRRKPRRRKMPVRFSRRLSRRACTRSGLPCAATECN